MSARGTTEKIGGVYVRPTRYEVTAYPGPEDSINRHLYVLTVENRGLDRWAVRYGEFVYRKDGHRRYEPLPSSRTERFKRAYRFSLEDALALARKVAPKMTVNGMGPPADVGLGTGG